VNIIRNVELMMLPPYERLLKHIIRRSKLTPLKSTLMLKFHMQAVLVYLSSGFGAIHS